MAQESWLPTWKTNTPQEGYELAVKLTGKAVRKKLRPVYANDADSLTFASQVVAINFQTVAAPNNYWI